jgi:hypothetical protein
VPKCCNKNLVPKCQLISVPGAKVPVIFSTWCQSASYFQYLVPKCQIFSVPGAKVPGSVRLGAGHVAGMEDVPTGQLHAHQAPVSRVSAHIQLYFTHCCACAVQFSLCIPDNGDVEPVLTVVVTPAGQPVCGEYCLALHRARALALSQEQSGHSPAQVSLSTRSFNPEFEPANRG